MMKRLLLILFTVWSFQLATATEGMWLPLLLQQLNEAEMQSMGMKMSAEDIYSVNKGSLKDAIVHFGGFCTGEVISEEGLVLTNHHCGYGQIQSHSSLQNNYLEDGFWAMNKGEELPNPGLFVTFIVRIEDVTDKMLANTTADMTEKEIEAWVKKNKADVIKQTERASYQDVMVRPFFEGHQYFLFVTETYKDIRLVGAPPSSIGKFGADTDNWVWPRHTGDFSLFRIYAGPDNKPAEYSADNVPFKPRHALPVSLDGVSADDFTMVFGFPGRTEEYLPHAAIKQRVDLVNPARIAVREHALSVINEAMRQDAEINIQYASKQSRIANAWKKWIGENQGIRTTGGLDKKLAYEKEFQKRVEENPEWKSNYGDLLSKLNEAYAELDQYAESRAYLSEITGRNIEMFRHLNTLHSVVKRYDSNGAAAVEERMDRIKGYLANFYKDYQQAVDQKVFGAVMALYFDKVYPGHQSAFAVEQYTNTGKNTSRLALALFRKSKLFDEQAVNAAMAEGPEALVNLIKEDYAYQFVRKVTEDAAEKVFQPYDKIQERISGLQKTYMKAQMDVFAEKRFYPDANSTMRVTYGKVASYSPRDAVTYGTHTYLEGVIEKYVPGDYEFDLPRRLLELYENKDYGQYADDGKVPVCFIGTNHTTGGNSGSPAIDAYGNLVGLNFDRAWEGTMSDINYDASICRNIMVDVRYILFIVDKYAGAGHLVEEMKLVHPKKK
jgi:hypothetical protein